MKSLFYASWSEVIITRILNWRQILPRSERKMEEEIPKSRVVLVAVDGSEWSEKAFDCKCEVCFQIISSCLCGLIECFISFRFFFIIS